MPPRSKLKRAHHNRGKGRSFKKGRFTSRRTRPINPRFKARTGGRRTLYIGGGRRTRNVQGSRSRMVGLSTPLRATPMYPMTKTISMEWRRTVYFQHRAGGVTDPDTLLFTDITPTSAYDPFTQFTVPSSGVGFPPGEYAKDWQVYAAHYQHYNIGQGTFKCTFTNSSERDIIVGMYVFGPDDSMELPQGPGGDPVTTRQLQEEWLMQHENVMRYRVLGTHNANADGQQTQHKKTMTIRWNRQRILRQGRNPISDDVNKLKISKWSDTNFPQPPSAPRPEQKVTIRMFAFYESGTRGRGNTNLAQTDPIVAPAAEIKYEITMQNLADVQFGARALIDSTGPANVTID